MGARVSSVAESCPVCVRLDVQEPPAPHKGDYKHARGYLRQCGRLRAMFLMDRKGPPTSMKDIGRDQCGFVAKMADNNSKNGTPRA